VIREAGLPPFHAFTCQVEHGAIAYRPFTLRQVSTTPPRSWSRLVVVSAAASAATAAEVSRRVAKRILIGIDEERLGRAMKAIEELPTRSRTARDIAELIDEPVYVAYEALRHLGYRVDRDYVASQVGTAEERVPLFERIAQIDTGDMTVKEIAERFGVSELRVQNALALLKRFAKVGGYKTFPRRTQKRRDSHAAGANGSSHADPVPAPGGATGQAASLDVPHHASAASLGRPAQASEGDAVWHLPGRPSEEPRAQPEEPAAAPDPVKTRRRLRMRLSAVWRLKASVKRGD
jgi:hypothetical protein